MALSEALESRPETLREAFREPELRAVTLAAAVLYFARLWEGSLDGDAAVYASVAKGIAESGDWLNLHVGSAPYWNKPPLLFWLTAPLVAVFGSTTFAACFWPALFGAASCVALHRLARELFDRNTALFAALVMLATPELLRYGTRLRLESVCVFFLVLSVLDLARSVRRQDPRRLVRVGLWIGMLFLAKGGPGFIALGIAVAYLVWERATRLLWTRSGALAVGLCLLLSLSWTAVQRWLNGPIFLDHSVKELFQTRIPGDPQNPLLFYPWRLVRTYSVWLPFVALGARLLWRERRERPAQARLLLCWLVIGSVFISLPHRLFARYLTSLYPATALLAGLWLARAAGPERSARVAAWLPRLAAAVAVALVCLPIPIHGDDAREARQLGAALDVLAPDEPVPVYGPVHNYWRGQFHFYLDRDVRVLTDLETLERERPPLVVTSRRDARELKAAGWRPQIESWRWTALRPPDPAATAAHGAAGSSSDSSRRLR